MLRALSSRLRDTLIGDVVRGVHVGLDTAQSEIGRAGSLESVNLRWIRVNDFLTSHSDRRSPSPDLGADEPDRDEGLGPSGCGGASGSIYGKKRAREGDLDPSHFLRLPLLLLRMPTSLKNVVTEWLSGVFDCHISPLSLGTRGLVRIWETWLKSVPLPTQGPAAKEVVITLGFSLPHLADEPADGTSDNEQRDGNDNVPRGVQQGLRSIDITMQPEDISRFVEAGLRIAQNRTAAGPKPWVGDARTRRILAGGHEQDGWAWKTEAGQTGDEADDEQPFVDALALYLDTHLALNLFHPSVRVTKIASSGFVLTGSRLKVSKTKETKAVCRLLADITRTSLGTEVAQMFK
ncbi:unnamed protein product [Parascedosporium putredinis]|uniref:Siroheme synthase n=1 Tax=Parascedosporium putredinis TaxID=1442378 RepID=A0A9P1GZG7_9PEZI|nr:unnamed protein product [Parascedosporium putredinis]CAI7991660.1 unnamed protein product [Parascedosporium putredinis]